MPDDSLRGNARGRRNADVTRGTLALSERKGHVGDTIVLKGRNLPPGEQFDVRWHSVAGSWGVLEADELVGPQYRPRSETVLTVESDESGMFDEEWTVPEDYGGEHTIEITDGETAIDEATFEIIPWFELERTTAQLGDTFRLTGYGLGPGPMSNNYQVAWDNGHVGFMTGVQNRGTATAEIRAVGPPGDHVIQVWHGYRGVPYLLRGTQSSYRQVGGGRQSRWTVEVTEPETDPETAWIDPLLDERPLDIHYPDVETDSEATIDITPQSGQPGTTATITGAGFPPGAAVDLFWYTHENDGPDSATQPPDDSVRAVPRSDVFPSVVADGDGEFEIEATIPTDIGSTRPITAYVGGEEIAATGFVLQPSIERFEPTSGPVGTDIEVEISGIGWTDYENAPYLVYDNDPLGYMCGTDSTDESGVLKFTLPATGEPGWHFIDVYPSLFSVEEDEPDFELTPHLSYLDNHPVRPLPALHFAFEITE